MQSDRFEAWPDPTGNWTVWDIEQDALAALGKVPLIGLTERLATAICQLLNAEDACLPGITLKLSAEAGQNRSAS